MIKLCRVDHRLLHGQVAFTWCNAVSADCILIASDEAASDEIRMTTMRLAKPAGVKLVIKNIEDSIKAINSGVTDKYDLLIVTGSVKDVYDIASSCSDRIKSINLGGTMKKDDVVKSFEPAVHLNGDELDLLKKLVDDGFEIEVRQTAKDKKLVITNKDL
ncbi:MAG: PTS sugar transporter subunit IIB [Erysipelotrichaceae bacterium]|nr:PTS sugar transporter subunit IIB [Erysipelotrichaceae bacterium]